MKYLALALAIPNVNSAAQAQAVKPELAGASFLVGEWSAGKGMVADTGETTTGSSRITIAANGSALLRQDRTNLFDKSGKPVGGFDQIMLIYPEGGTLHADYSDGTHVIHYTQADLVPGKSVTFLTARGGGPGFKLTYTLTTPETLSVAFAMSPPGSATFSPIATGTLERSH